MKTNNLLVLLFAIILIDNIVASAVLPVSMHLFSNWYTLDGKYTIDKTIFASGIIFLLSPAYTIASPLLGWLSDNIGRKKPLIACLSISLSGYIVLSFANHVDSILLGLFSILLGNAGSSSMTLVQAATADISQGSKRAYMLGLIVAIMLPIFFFTAELGEQILSITLDMPLALNAITGAAIFLTGLNIFLVILKLPETHHTLPVPTSGKDSIFCKFLRLKNNKPVLKLILLLAMVQFSCGLCYEPANHHISKLVGFAEAQMLNYIEYSVMLFSLCILYPLALRFFSVSQILIGSIALCFIGALGYAIKIGMPFQWISLVGMAIGQCTAIAAIWWLLLELVTPRDWGLNMGIKGAVWALALTLSVLLGDSLITEGISSAISFYIATSILLLSVVFAYTILKPRDAKFAHTR